MIGSPLQTSALLQFVNSLSVVVVLTFAAILLRNRITVRPPLPAAVLDGAIFGAVGVAAMLFPFTVAPGTFLDVRVVPVVLAGPFGGGTAAIVAGLIVAGFRAVWGGPGVYAGVVQIMAIAAIGAAIAPWWRTDPNRVRLHHLLLIGLALFAVTMAATALIPDHLRAAAQSAFVVPVAVTHILGVLVLGLLLLYEERRRRTDVELRESEARLRAIVDNSHASVFLKDAERRYLRINRVFADRFNVAVGDVVGKTGEDIYPPDVAARVRDQDEAVLERQEVITQEIDMPYADGNVHSEISVKFPIFDAEGGVSGLGGVVADITQIKRAEEVAWRTEEQFRGFFEKAELIFVHLDATGRVVACNDFLLRLTGRGRAEAVGADWIETFIPAEDRDVIRRVLNQSIDIGDVAVLPHFENDIQTKSGERRTIAWDNVLTYDPDGRMSGVISIGADVTERRRALTTIRHEKERAEHYLGIAGSLVVALDILGEITLINRRGCELLGYEEGEVIGRNWFDLAIPPAERDYVRDVFFQIVSGEIEPVERFENEVITREGKRLLFTWQNSFVKDKEGRIVGSLSSGIDITAQRHAEAEARELHDRLAHVARLSTMGEMASGFAHELNQPLAAINNYARGIIRRLRTGTVPDTEELIVTLEKLAEQSLRAGDVIRRIRWFIQKNAPETAPIDINKAIHDAVALLDDEAMLHGATVTLDLASPLPLVIADAVQIQQVVLNLARNAMEAMSGQSAPVREVDIRTAASAGGGVEITVSDTGPGLPEDRRADVFEPFVTTKSDGMGIGLSICRSIVGAHGGELTVESPPGAGAIFRFVLPSADTEAPEVAG